MKISRSSLLALSTIFSLSICAVAIDIEEAKRFILSETPPIDIRISHPSKGEAFDAVFDIPFTAAEFMMIQSQSTASPEDITDENVWRVPLTLYGAFDFGMAVVQDALAGMGDLTEYKISYSGGPAAVRLMCSLETVVNKGTVDEQTDSFIMDEPGRQYRMPRGLDGITCQAWLWRGFRPVEPYDEEGE